MTIEAGGTERKGMRRHEPKVHLTVACITGLESEGPNIAVMAVVTGERFARSRTLVTV